MSRVILKNVLDQDVGPISPYAGKVSLLKFDLRLNDIEVRFDGYTECLICRP